MPCGTCQWLGVISDKAGKRVVRDHFTYPCEFPLPEMPALPDSITTAYGYVVLTNRAKRDMAPNDGQHCPVFKPIKG